MVKQTFVEQDRIWSAFSTLPCDAQYQVLEFVMFLQARYAPERSAKAKMPRLSDDPFVGMWKDRQEMTDSTAYVRQIRQQEWGRPV